MKDLNKDSDEIHLKLYYEGRNIKKNFVKLNIICNRKNCRIPYGECLNNKICVCLEGYSSQNLLIIKFILTIGKKIKYSPLYLNLFSSSELDIFIYADYIMEY